MRQVARRLRDGSLELIEVPDPAPRPGTVAVSVVASVISSGTERATMEVARKGLIAKARARPDQAKKLLDRARSEGIRETAAFVRHRLDDIGALGYSAAGTVIEAGADVRGLSPGDRVAIAGGGAANHAEIDIVPGLLCAPVPTGVSDEDAAFTTLGAIAMQGFRRSDATVGATVAVIGLGLIGQLTARIATAAGCDALGIDLDERMVELARSAGSRATLRDQVGQGLEDSADAVIVCASSSSDDPIRLAAKLARDRAPIVVVGAVGMDLPRQPFYEKELDLRLSRSYGPGRYDPEYELHGHDYPIGYVRWTEQRNMQSFLDLTARGTIRPAELVTHRFAIDDAEVAYAALESERPVAIVLTYPGVAAAARTRVKTGPTKPRLRRRVSPGKPRFGIVGAGSFSTGRIIPGLIEAGFEAGAVASASGLSAESALRRFGFGVAVSSADELLTDDSLDLIVIATQHDSHADLAARALERGAAVYVEKPLALDSEGLESVVAARRESGAPLFVGFNRRYAPLAAELRELDLPRLMSYRVNAGKLAPDQWTNDLARGGGRLKGEGCHFIDFLCDQARTDPVSVIARGFVSDPELALAAVDNFSVQIGFANGSVGTVHYAADAPTGPGKERFETSAPGGFGEIDDFRTGSIWQRERRRSLGSRRQDKGFAGQFQHMASVVRDEAQPPSVESFYLSTLATLAAARSLETGCVEAVVQDVVEREPLAVASEPTE